MLASVVLDQDLDVGVAQVQAVEHPAVRVVHLDVDLRLGQSREHNEHPEPRLHGRVHPGADVRGRTPSRSRATTHRLLAVTAQVVRGAAPGAHEPVADHHEVDQAEQLGELHEDLPGLRDAETAHRGDRCAGRRHVCLEPRSRTTVPRAQHADVLVDQSRQRNSEHSGGTGVAREGPRRMQQQRRFCPEQGTCRHRGMHVHPAKNGPEPRSPHRRRRHTGGQRPSGGEGTAQVQRGPCGDRNGRHGVRVPRGRAACGPSSTAVTVGAVASTEHVRVGGERLAMICTATTQVRRCLCCSRGRGPSQARLTALITALSEAVTMLASTPTPHSSWSPTAHSTYAAARASPPEDSACSW